MCWIWILLPKYSHFILYCESLEIHTCVLCDDSFTTVGNIEHGERNTRIIHCKSKGITQNILKKWFICQKSSSAKLNSLLDSKVTGENRQQCLSVNLAIVVNVYLYSNFCCWNISYLILYMGRIFITQNFGSMDGAKSSKCSVSCTFCCSSNNFWLHDALKYMDHRK